ncbi:MAG: leucyl aminopeptidase [Micavibrio sp.]|nr:leucyl aminopeptidase [Micavibrio sp.]
MSLQILFSTSKSNEIRTAVIPFFNKGELGKGDWPVALGEFVRYALKVNSKYKGGVGEILDLVLPDAPGMDGIERVIVLGLGKADELTALKAEQAGGKLAVHVGASGVSSAALYVEEGAVSPSLKSEELAAALANGFKLRSYKFERYKSKPEDEDAKPSVFEDLQIIYAGADSARDVYAVLDSATEGAYTARDLVNTAPNELYPESYAQFIKDELKPLGVEVEVLDEKKMLKLGMGAIMAVGQGSEKPPRMVIMRWNGKKNDEAPLAFVGKGVTFDTGGISLKPGAGMGDMKMDMGGSAAVVGLMKSLALRKANANVVGVVGLAENMPSSRAYRPGDVITSYSGKTIEVLNTDAEGRLVLADCLTYVQRTYKPKFVINLATLTGAILVALGHEYCGTFANDDSLWAQMDNASTRTGEKVWRMPLDEAWTKMVKSDVADIQNIGKEGRNAGSCTAAAFLQHFIEEDVKWAHMDIAGTAWRKSDQATIPKFGTGYGVRLLNELVSYYYEG